MTRPLFFIHVPKTAGTSFRVAMEQTFGKDNVFADYGPKAVQTHPLVMKHIHVSRDPYGLISRMSKLRRRNTALAGHVDLKDYGAFFPIQNVVAFIREPIERCVSEYQHAVRHQNYEKSISCFIKKSRIINIQARYLSNAPLSAFGFVGLTEDYPVSLAMINAYYDLELPDLDLNKAPKSDEQESFMSEDDVSLFTELNQKDFSLYEHCKDIFELRKSLFGKGRRYTHGEYYIDSDGLINGFAFRQQDASPVGLLIVQNNQVQAEVDAKEFFEAASWLTLPRRGYVGFRCSLKRLLKSDAEVSVLVKDTEQPLLKRSAPFDRSRSV